MSVPKLRFNEFKEPWVITTLGEIFEITSGTTPLRSIDAFFTGGVYYWVKTTDLNNGLI